MQYETFGTFLNLCLIFLNVNVGSVFCTTIGKGRYQTNWQVEILTQFSQMFAMSDFEMSSAR